MFVILCLLFDFACFCSCYIVLMFYYYIGFVMLALKWFADSLFCFLCWFVCLVFVEFALLVVGLLCYCCLLFGLVVILFV